MSLLEFKVWEVLALICPVLAVIASTYSNSVVRRTGCHRCDVEMTRPGTPPLFLDCRQLMGWTLPCLSVSFFLPYNSLFCVLFNSSNHGHLILF